MKLYMLKCFGLVCLLFLAVLTGIEVANNGIHKMKGYQDPNFQNDISLQQNAPHLENENSSHDFEEKKKKLEELSTYNFFSSMGKKMAEGLSSSSEKLIQRITN